MNQKKQKIKKISALSALILLAGLLGGNLAKQLEKTQLGQLLEKKLNLKPTDSKVAQAQAANCIEQQEENNTVLFVGCNGFF